MMKPPNNLVVFSLAGRRFALPLDAVDRVERAAAIIPAPQESHLVSGEIIIHGRLLPVLDVRALFCLPYRELEVTDHFIIASAAGRTVALIAQDVYGLVEFDLGEVLPPDSDACSEHCLGTILRDGDGICICDLDSIVLLLDEERPEGAQLE